MTTLEGNISLRLTSQSDQKMNATSNMKALIKKHNDNSISVSSSLCHNSSTILLCSVLTTPSTWEQGPVTEIVEDPASGGWNSSLQNPPSLISSFHFLQSFLWWLQEVHHNRCGQWQWQRNRELWRRLARLLHVPSSGEGK